jgi:hypothetical protein
MNFQTTAGRVVNRKGLRIVADESGVITTDDVEIASIFTNMGFISLDKVEVKEITPKKKSNVKI